MSGYTCQSWSSYRLRYELNDETGLGDHNYCRNPDGETRPWCFVNESPAGWEYCVIPVCAGWTRL